ncbi:MAG TPA: SapB/AmfS family lanthipeptide [Pseudonocardiaceae bacterium]|jgi:hypothetical protein|nr:SapB/AmfS family lanthipeptide [Pseudonocardiaceae bacterium]
MEQVLELQELDTPEVMENGGGGGSRASLLLCGNSSLSVTTCN